MSDFNPGRRRVMQVVGAGLLMPSLAPAVIASVKDRPQLTDGVQSGDLLGDRAMRERYRTQFFAVYEKNFQAYDWPKRILELAANSKAKLNQFDPQEAKRFDQRGIEAASRVKNRLAAIRIQLEESAQLRSIGGKATLGKYAWERNADEKEADERDFEGRHCFYVKAGLKKGGDFRLPLATGPGRYRLGTVLDTGGST